MLGGMIEIPTSEWVEHLPDMNECLQTVNLYEGFDWHLLPGEARHTFTHFHFDMKIIKIKLTLAQTKVMNSDLKEKWGEAFWCLPDRLTDYALPTTMKKIVKHALK